MPKVPKVTKVTRQSDKPEKARDCVIVLNCSGEQMVWLFVEFQVLKGLKASAQCCIPAEPVPRGCRCTMQKSWLEAWHIVFHQTRDQVRETNENFAGIANSFRTIAHFRTNDHGELLLWISKRLHGNLVQFHLGVAGQAHAVETFGEHEANGEI